MTVQLTMEWEPPEEKVSAQGKVVFLVDARNPDCKATRRPVQTEN